jgi:hypothetical protein
MTEPRGASSAATTSRAGPAVFLLGAVLTAAGFVALYLAWYQLETSPPFPSAPVLHQFELVSEAGYIAIGLGVLLVGVGWALRVVRLAPPGAPRGRTWLAVVLGLAGVVLTAGGYLFNAAMTEAELANVILRLPPWTALLSDLTTGVGVGLAGIAVFLTYVRRA